MDWASPMLGLDVGYALAVHGLCCTGAGRGLEWAWAGLGMVCTGHFLRKYCPGHGLIWTMDGLCMV
jgi:hypothetical protein